mmetsp:Transcript_85416/g.135406  ORF Transcript_85416/g.135406 Transcript_85416/m.135406 type:complete len:241 (+) Transcript_85416:817-1539(+)
MLQFGKAIGEFGTCLPLLVVALAARLLSLRALISHGGCTSTTHHRLLVPAKSSSELRVFLHLVTGEFHQLRKSVRLQFVDPNQVALGVEGVGSLGHLLMQLLHLPPLLFQSLFGFLGSTFLVPLPRFLLRLRLPHAFLFWIHQDFTLQRLDPGLKFSHFRLCGVEFGPTCWGSSELGRLAGLALVGLLVLSTTHRQMHARPTIHLTGAGFLFNLPLRTECSIVQRFAVIVVHIAHAKSTD